MNRKELNLIKELIKWNEDCIEQSQNKIKYFQTHHYASPKEIKEQIKLEEYAIKKGLEEIATLQSIYRIVKEALKNGKTN